MVRFYCWLITSNKQRATSGGRMPDDANMTTKDRAYTSPIWYTP
ncbi:MAG: DUF3604 domain-containing protein [Woeseiaceae bacterium]